MYKRQELTGLPVVYQDERLTTVLAYDPVSYTHLDVYKRQALHDVQYEVAYRRIY